MERRNEEVELLSGFATLPGVTLDIFHYWLELEYLSSLLPFAEPVPLADARRIDPEDKLVHIRKDFDGDYFHSFDIWRGRGRRGKGEFLLHVNMIVRRNDQLLVEYVGEDVDSSAGAKSFEWWIRQAFDPEIKGLKQDEAERVTSNRSALSWRMDDRRYWEEVHRQAHASGNITEYLRGRDYEGGKGIPKSTYYDKVREYGLSKKSKKRRQHSDAEMDT